MIKLNQLTTAEAMSHPDVAATVNALGKMCDELRTQNQALREALKRIVFTVPALDGAGGLIVEHHGFDGEYLGVEQVDPMQVIQEMAQVAQAALAQAEGGV